MKKSFKYENNFIYKRICEDIKQSKCKKIITRFPPEPSGHLHLGHIKSMYLNLKASNITKKSYCNLRFDNTNPEKEKKKFIKSIIKDIKWMKFDYKSNVFYVSNYFEFIYKMAKKLIKNGLAYVCELNNTNINIYRGTYKKKGVNSPYRDRSIEENIKIFKKMKQGFFKKGMCTLRAKISMSSKNLNLRDPVLYRIKDIQHKTRKNIKKWYIYPMYDFAHAVSDAIEGITHSICTLEFENNKPLYNWVIKSCNFTNKPNQIEFSKLNISNNILSKRKIRFFINNNYLQGWDDPRLLTISGLRRRGFTPESIKNSLKKIGISKKDSLIDIEIFKSSIRNILNKTAYRKNVVTNPLILNIEKLVKREIKVPNHPKNKNLGYRNITISNKVFIEKKDFSEKKIVGKKILYLNNKIRLMNACTVKCRKIIKDKNKNIVEVVCKICKESFVKKKFIKNKDCLGIIHWVDANNFINSEVIEYKKLFNKKNLSNISNYEALKKYFNKESISIKKNVKIESSLKNAKKEESFQFIRLGYFCTENIKNKNKIIFNKITSLKKNKNR